MTRISERWRAHGFDLDLPPIKDDDLRMADVLYVSGALNKTTK